ncbi:MAG: hypothetical protein RBG13Loki_0036 [Promethearchaeota archaeon CR_4]|nr:MAG: hypothetical protein RBG13Loki_0036 [Candidatus Lokiarchaeota archaeon CR_4]
MGFRKIFLKTFRKAIPFITRYWNHYEIRGLEHIASPGSKVLAINHGGGWDYDNFLIMSALDHVKTDNHARKRMHLFVWDRRCDSTSGLERAWSDLYRQFSAIPIHIETKDKPPIPYEIVDNVVKRGELMVVSGRPQCRMVRGVSSLEILPGHHQDSPPLPDPHHSHSPHRAHASPNHPQ